MYRRPQIIILELINFSRTSTAVRPARQVNIKNVTQKPIVCSASLSFAAVPIFLAKGEHYPDL